MRRKTKNTLTLICGVLALALLTGLVLNLYGAFDKKKVNPNNLINGEISGYKTAEPYNNNYRNFTKSQEEHDIFSQNLLTKS